MATLLRKLTSEGVLSVDGDEIVLTLDGEELRIGTSTDDLDELLKLVARRVKQAAKEAKAGDAVSLDEIRDLSSKLASLADKLGSAQIEVRDSAKQREMRMTPGIPETRDVADDARTSG